MVKPLQVQVTEEAVQLPTSQDLKSKMTLTTEDLDSHSMLSKTPNGNIVCKELVSQLFWLFWISLCRLFRLLVRIVAVS